MLPAGFLHYRGYCQERRIMVKREPVVCVTDADNRIGFTFIEGWVSRVPFAVYLYNGNDSFLEGARLCAILGRYQSVSCFMYIHIS